MSRVEVLPRVGIERTLGRRVRHTCTSAASRLLSLSQNLTGTTQDLTLNFSYTDASQLSTRSTSNTLYDWAVPTVNKAYVPDGLNRYATVAGTNYGYDANGNLTSDGTRTFLYDTENRLKQVTGGAGLLLTYDPLGRLRQTVSGATTTQFLYDGDRLVAEYNGSNVLQRRYVHGAGVDEPLLWYEGSTLTDRRHLHSDERGSVIAWSNSSGAGTLYTYGPYGEPNVWTGSRFKYTGQIALPEASLYHYKARVYDPVLGRFLQTDPVGYTDDFNLYAYVYNDPLNLTDSTGMCTGSRIANDDGTCKNGGFTTNSSGDARGMAESRRQALAISGAAVGGSLAAAASVPADAASFGLNSLLTPAEIASGATLGAVLAVTGGDLIDKMADEISRIVEREQGPLGVQYSLRAASTGTYLNRNTGGTTKLAAGDVWKYGQTTGVRYSPTWLNSMKLRFVPEYRGGQVQILLMEKYKIYAYRLGKL